MASLFHRCPICDLRCVWRINIDCIECPDHGEITGVQLIQYKGMSPAHMLIEIQGDRAQWQTRRLCARMIEKIQKSQPLRVPKWSECFG